MTELTGRKVFAIVASAFGVIIAVNLLLAYKAVTTFPGLEVPNSYVASQTWDAERAAQKALGWELAAEYDHAAQALELTFTDAAGRPAPLTALSVLVGRPHRGQGRPVARDAAERGRVAGTAGACAPASG